jgi:hypothetical protein
MQRSIQQNRLYHELASQLWKTNNLQVWDGRFLQYGYPNPIVLRPSGFSYDSFRDLLKQLDFSYPKQDSIGISSAKLDKQQINSHILFLEVLCAEL